jgi:hypothetical protein
MDSHNLDISTLIHLVAFSVLVSDGVGCLVREATNNDFITTLRVRPSSKHVMSTLRSYIGRGGRISVNLIGSFLFPRVNSISALEKVFFLALGLSVDRLGGARDDTGVRSSPVKSQRRAQLVSTLREGDLSHLEDIIVIIAFHQVVFVGRGDEVGSFTVPLEREVLLVSILNAGLISTKDKPEISHLILVGVVSNQLHTVITQNEVSAEATPVPFVEGVLRLEAHSDHLHVGWLDLRNPVDPAEREGVASILKVVLEEDYGLLGSVVRLDSEYSSHVGVDIAA